MPHNIQPSKTYSYRVDACNPLSCKYTSLLSDINTLKGLKLCSNNCGYKEKLEEIPTDTNGTNVLIHYLSDEEKEKIDSVLTDSGTCTELLMLGYDLMKE